VHDLIEIHFRCLAEEMKMISHEDKGMYFEMLLSVTIIEFPQHDLPNSLQRQREKLLVQTTRSYMVRMGVGFNQFWSSHQCL
jgi:hypothetical protein